MEEFSTSLKDFYTPFAELSSKLNEGFGFEALGKFFGGSSDLGKGLVYMIERIQETLNF